MITKRNKKEAKAKQRIIDRSLRLTESRCRKALYSERVHTYRIERLRKNKLRKALSENDIYIAHLTIPIPDPKAIAKAKEAAQILAITIESQLQREAEAQELELQRQEEEDEVEISTANPFVVGDDYVRISGLLGGHDSDTSITSDSDESSSSDSD